MKIIIGTDEFKKIHRLPDSFEVVLTNGYRISFPGNYKFEEKYFEESRPQDTVISDDRLARFFQDHNRIPPEAVRTAVHRGSDFGFDLYRYTWYEVSSPVPD